MFLLGFFITLQRLFHLPNGTLHLNLQRRYVEGVREVLHLLLRQQHLFLFRRLLHDGHVFAVELVQDLGRRGRKKLVLGQVLDVLAAANGSPVRPGSVHEVEEGQVRYSMQQKLSR